MDHNSIEVVLTVEAQQQIKDLKNAVIAARMYKLIDRLKQWPNVSGVKALSGNLAGKYRMRTGDYRIQFSVATKIDATGLMKRKVIVEKAGHRDGFYDD